MSPIYGLSLLEVGRLEAFRLGYVTGQLWISIGGSFADGDPQGFLITSLSISDQLNEVPNTLIATVRGTKPIEGAIVRLSIGSKNARPIYSGNILRVTRRWAIDNPAHVLYDIEASDPTWLLGAVLVTKRYRSTSATAIATNLLTFAPAGFTGAIQPGLPTLDEISFTDVPLMECFARLATRIGGYCFADYQSRLHLFISEADVAPPRPLNAAHPSLSHVTYQRDLTQIITRCVVEGGGGNAIATVPPGFTVLPVSDTSWYSPTGGYMRSGPQRLAYSGLTAGGAGGYIGPGITPTTGPTVAVSIGASAVEPGAHAYAYTWVTASGETLPSPIGSGTSGPAGVSAPPALVIVEQTFISTSPPGRTIGAAYHYRFAWSYTTAPGGSNALAPSADQSALSPFSPETVSTCVEWHNYGYPDDHQASVANKGWGTDPIDPRATRLNMYRGLPENTGAITEWRLLFSITIADLGVNFVDTFDDAKLVANANGTHPVAPTTTGNVVAQRFTVSGIAPGPSGTTARKIYRTIANGSQLKLLTTIANNTDTALASFDNTADASLGADAPTIDTSGLTAIAKLVNAGSTEIVVTSVAPFSSGFALVGNQVIRYTGVSATQLTGVPASGEGALLQSVAHGTPISVAPQLTGIPASGAGAINWTIAKGDEVNVVVIVDDTGAQSALAALIGGTGIRETILQDGRISLVEAAARGRAYLTAHAHTLETFAHRSRDPATKSGSLITVNLPAPTDIAGTFRLQDVTIAAFNPRGLLQPSYTARASSQRFTFEDLLRQVANSAPPPPTGEV